MKQQIAGFPNCQNPSGLIQTDKSIQIYSGNQLFFPGMSDQFCPGKIRFQYQKDVPLLIVGDGSRLTMIDYQVKQVQSWPVKNSPLGALLDPERDLSKYAKVIPTGSDEVLSVEVKDPKRPEYGTITMVFVRDGSAPAGLRLRGWVALDSQNNRTRIDLSNQKFNVAVADSAFKWTDPRPKQRGRAG